MNSLYELGPFRFDAAAGALTLAGVPVALGARGAAILAALVAQPGEFVGKAQLMDAAWPRAVVEEGNLAVQISAIRRALAQAPGGEGWVETLARRGYRFAGPVVTLARTLPPARPATARLDNLPDPLTSFVGREREIAEVRRLLRGSRLLTLVGIGGIGKTRLALKAAAEVIDDYADGVWFVDLAPLADPALVASAVAQVLGVQEGAGIPVIETVCKQVRGRRLLLILDNCEHVLDACAQLAAAVLRAAPALSIIATSREALGVPGEQAYPMPALSLPDESASMQDLRQSEAVQLFVERATRHQPDFDLTAERAHAVAALCIHLDGIPLALELAAARVRSLSVDEINARLDDRLKLLTGGARTALPRQQTLRGALDWSHGMLSEPERVLLRRLAIFAGGFTLEAAIDVACGDAEDEFAATDTLAQLVARSLIVFAATPGGGRYKLLETTRIFALEKLGEAGESTKVKRRHAGYFRKRFARAYDDWIDMSDAQWHAIYLPERDNIRVALDWAIGARSDPSLGIALSGASGALWAELSLTGEGRQRLEAALAQVDASTPVEDRAPLWLWLGLRWRYSAPTQAMTAMQNAIDGFRELGEPAALAHALSRMGAMLARMDRFDEADHAMQEALTAVEAAARRKSLGFYHSGLGEIRMLAGDLSAARSQFEKALALYRDTGAESAALAIIGILADMTWAIGDLDAALAAFVETVARLRDSPLTRKYILGIALTNLAGVHTERGELDAALAAAREGLPWLYEDGFAWNVLDHLALRAALAGKTADGARIAGYVDAMVTASASPRQRNEARARASLEALLQSSLDAEEIARLLAEGAAMSEEDACRVSIEG